MLSFLCGKEQIMSKKDSSSQKMGLENDVSELNDGNEYLKIDCPTDICWQI